MTREEAIKVLEYIKLAGNGESEYKNDAQAIAIDMAIKALEQQSCEDAISRKQALKETKALIRGDYDPEYIIETLKMLPPVTPDALDKIRERISLEKIGYPPSAGYYKAIVKVLQIIDQYKAESEGER